MMSGFSRFIKLRMRSVFLPLGRKYPVKGKGMW